MDGKRDTGTEASAFVTDLSRRHWPGYLLVWLVVFLLFLLLYLIARRVVINEIRYHAQGVAIATAAGVDPESLDDIRTEMDMEKMSFKRIQKLMDRIEEQNPDVRYIYLMRRAGKENAKDTDYEYVVEETEVDENGNGVIDAEESTNPPGTPYDASDWPAMVNAWYSPGADEDISPDPPYPDLMSGYAPIRNAADETVAIVGVDVLARTVGMKLLVLQVVIVSVGILMSLLTTIVIRSYYKQRRLTAERDALIHQLQEALSRVKTLSGLLPICASCKKIRDDKGYWERLEIYLTDHTDVSFTHSVCPDCLKKLYPEQYDKLKRKGLLRYVREGSK